MKICKYNILVLNFLAYFLYSSMAYANATPTFTEFVASLPPQIGGAFTVDGDIPIYGMDNLYQYYLEHYGQTIATKSAVKVDATGNYVIWGATDRHNLTYCIQKDNYVNGFSDTQYSTVVNAMKASGDDWEAIADVDFKHVYSEDLNCSQSTKVMFKVLKTWASWQGGGVLAQSFFPDAPIGSRNLWIAADMPSNTPSPLSFIGLLRHELGHTLGLVHEHARGKLCPETGWSALTDYDVYSVMFYRTPISNCGGATLDYYISKLDKEGIKQLYPFPTPPAPPNQPPIARISITSSDNIYVAGKDIIFDGTASNDRDGRILSFVWDFGDGVINTTSTPVTSHKYKTTGIYKASLVVMDDKNISSLATSIMLDVKINPVSVIMIINYFLFETD